MPGNVNCCIIFKQLKAVYTALHLMRHFVIARKSSDEAISYKFKASSQAQPVLNIRLVLIIHLLLLR